MEQKFANLFNWVHAMLNGGKFSLPLKAYTAMLHNNNLEIFWEEKEKHPVFNTTIW